MPLAAACTRVVIANGSNNMTADTASFIYVIFLIKKLPSHFQMLYFYIEKPFEASPCLNVCRIYYDQSNSSLSLLAWAICDKKGLVRPATP